MTAALRWLARGEHELPADLGWLTPGEAERAARMRFTKRRTEYLLRRWVGKQAVAAALMPAASPELATLRRIEVANRPTGAPYVLVDGEPVGLDVSLTDRAGWAVCVVGHDLTRVGCDLEIVEPRTDGFVRDFLTPAEQAYVAARPSAAARHETANLMWSAKESALKVLRTGLRRDTRTVEVQLQEPSPDGDGWAGLQVIPKEGGRFPGWWRRDGVFVLTVTADAAFPHPVQLPGSAPLQDAVPVHSWVQQPVAGD
jgi:4'-phosphopantetheinyl transferase